MSLTCTRTIFLMTSRTFGPYCTYSPMAGIRRPRESYKAYGACTGHDRGHLSLWDVGPEIHRLDRAVYSDRNYDTHSSRSHRRPAMRPRPFFLMSMVEWWTWDSLRRVMTRCFVSWDSDWIGFRNCAYVLITFSALIAADIVWYGYRPQ